MTFKARGVALVVAAAFVAGLPAAALAQRDDKKRSKQERDEIETLVKLLDGAIAGEPAPTDVQMKIEPVFLKSQEARIFVPFTLDDHRLSRAARTRRSTSASSIRPSRSIRRRSPSTRGTTCTSCRPRSSPAHRRA